MLGGADAPPVGARVRRLGPGAGREQRGRQRDARAGAFSDWTESEKA